jgi:hypothetical protein
MATVHVGANADPHPSIILVPPEGWPVPTEGRRASSTSTKAPRARQRPSCQGVALIASQGEAGAETGWRKDSNLQSPDPESGALPLSHAPASELAEGLPPRRIWDESGAHPKMSQMPIRKTG